MQTPMSVDALLDRIGRTELWRARSGRTGIIKVIWVGVTVKYTIHGDEFQLSPEDFIHTYVEAHLNTNVADSFK